MFLLLRHSLDPLLDEKGLDVDQPPVALLVLHEVPHQLSHVDAPLESHVSDALFEEGQSLEKIPACG